MPAAKKHSWSSTIAEQVDESLEWLKSKSTPKDRDNLKRFGIDAKQAFGVSMANIQVLGKILGRNHALASALWKTGWHEARMLAAFVDEPERVTAAQMDRWCREFDNWGICDTLCFKLFDQTPDAWKMVTKWRVEEDEFVKRAAFALLASLAGHDQKSGDEPFLENLPYLEKAAADDRNFVKKGISWALRRLGGRSAVLHAAALETAQRLAKSKDSAGARWVGKDALRDLVRPVTLRRIRK